MNAGGKTGVDLGAPLGLDFDPVEMAGRFEAERDKRIRKDHNGQYIKVDGAFQSFFEPRFRYDSVERDTVEVDTEVLIIGAGFAGLQIGAQLTKRGIHDFLIVDRCADFGGNWFWNRYPGAACDSDAYSYLPLLEETGYIPTKNYVDAGEIQAHARRIAEHFQFTDRALLQTTVTGATWNEHEGHWDVTTDRGDKIRARFTVLAGGESVAAPKLPGIPGIGDFKGRSFHSSRWDYEYTGGGVKGGLEKLADKRVAIIGTGCSAVQIIPHLGAAAKKLIVFQRTPSAVSPRNNQATDPRWAAALEPGWQSKRQWHLNATMEGRLDAEPLDDSGFCEQTARIGGYAMTISGAAAESGIELDAKDITELASMQFIHGLHKQIDDIIDDPEVAASLKPYYHPWCKRTTWSDTYLQTFNRDSVTLIDVPSGVESITEKGVIANGVEHEVDLIVYASGFEASNPSVWELVRFPLIGRDGVDLRDYWADSFETFHGVLVHNFPNYLQSTLVGVGLGANYIYGNGKQAEHIADVLKRCIDDDIISIEATKNAEQEWRAALTNSTGLSFGGAECTPGYFNADGDPENAKGVVNNVYGSLLEYIDILTEWRSKDEWTGVSVVRR